MAQKLNPFSGRQFLDANGDPYSGAKLFTYLAGSTTKTTVTKDSAGVSNHTNPIILNTRGEPADAGGAAQAIWQPDGTSIKLVLAPSTDTDPPVSAISTWDNLEGVNDTTSTSAQDQWVAGPTPTFVSTTSFTLVGDQTSEFHVGRRIRTTNSGGTIYSTITVTAYTTLTTVTVVNDSGALDSGLSAVSYGFLTADDSSIPGGDHQAETTFKKTITFSKGSDIASASGINIGTDGNYFDVTGTTNIAAINSVGVGTVVKLHFDDSLTLVHDATNLVLPGGANITTRAGDEAEFVEYAAGDWRCTNYLTTTGTPINNLSWAVGLGNGEDGALTYTTTTNLASGIYQATTLDIQSAATINPTDASDSFLFFLVQGKATIAGTVDADGHGGAGGAGSTGTAATNGSVGILGGAAGSGGDENSNTSGSGGNGLLWISGGAAVTGVSTAGNDGGNATDSKANDYFLNFGMATISASTYNFTGGGGGGGGAASGGGAGGTGGNGGGTVIILADEIVFTGTITADGGNGAADADGAGGGGGGGGCILLLCNTLTTNTGTTSVAAGTGGAGTGGADGGDGGTGLLKVSTFYNL